jgi:hypothetical protein
MWGVGSRQLPDRLAVHLSGNPTYQDLYEVTSNS